MRLIGVRSLLECDEALTKCSQSSTADRTATVVPKPVRRGTRPSTPVPVGGSPIGRHYSTTRPNRRPGFQPGINVAESAIKT
jgi:hypothetical protein